MFRCIEKRKMLAFLAELCSTCEPKTNELWHRAVDRSAAINTVSFECKNICSCEKMERHSKRDIRDCFSTRIGKLEKVIQHKQQQQKMNWNDIPQNFYDKNHFQSRKRTTENWEKIEDTYKWNGKKAVKWSLMENNVQGIRLSDLNSLFFYHPSFFFSFHSLEKRPNFFSRIKRMRKEHKYTCTQKHA